jgi:hypothetical protein
LCLLLWQYFFFISRACSPGALSHQFVSHISSIFGTAAICCTFFAGLLFRPEAEFLDVLGKKVLWCLFLLAIHDHLY